VMYMSQGPRFASLINQKFLFNEKASGQGAFFCVTPDCFTFCC
jgi:hypothetical protein